MKPTQEQFSLNSGASKKQFPITKGDKPAVASRMHRPLCLFFLPLFLTSCSTFTVNKGPINGVGGPPVPAAQVKVFYPGRAPRAFEIVSPVSIYEDPPTRSDIPIQTAAGQLGADAIIALHTYVAPNIIGPRFQSGIAVRLLADGQAQATSEAKSGVAIVTLLEAAPANQAAFSAIRDAMELAAATKLHLSGYCPIYTSTSLPSGKDVPSTPTFHLLKGSEAEFCEKMLVLKLSTLQMVDEGLYAKNHLEVQAKLISRSGDAILWSAERKSSAFRWYGLLRFDDLPSMGVHPVSNTAAWIVANQVLAKLPKNQ